MSISTSMGVPSTATRTFASSVLSAIWSGMTFSKLKILNSISKSKIKNTYSVSMCLAMTPCNAKTKPQKKSIISVDFILILPLPMQM